MADQTFTRLRYKYFPDHLIGEILSKRWMEFAVPMVVMISAFVLLGTALPNFYSAVNLSDLGRQYAEFGFVVLAMAAVMIGGGIDLSVGSILAIANLAALSFLNILGWPLWVVIPAVLMVGAAAGAVNGLLIGYLKLRAFLTTLVTLIIYRAVVDLLLLEYAVEISTGYVESDALEFLGDGDVYGIPSDLLVFIILALVLHVVLSRTRVGWYIMAVGGARRAAYNAGIAVKRTIFLTYVFPDY